MSDATGMEGLLSRNPRGYTDQDIETIVANLRDSRRRYINLGDKAAGKAGAKKGETQNKRESAQDIIAKVGIDDILNGI